MSIKNMNVAEIELSLAEWGNENDPESNWATIQACACFKHTEACEFIVHVGSPEGGGFRDDHELSAEINMLLRTAYISGFNYVCFIG